MKWRSLALVFFANTLGGISPACLVFLLNPNVGYGVLARQAAVGLAYSWCIGSLAFLAVEPVARWVHRRLPRILQFPAMVATFAATAVAGSIPASMLLVLIGFIGPERMWPVYRQGLLIAIGITVTVGSIATAFGSVRHRLDAATIELRNRQLAEERAHKLATEARLSSLESRVHPHFLFNTLNSISALIREDPRTAERTVERLACLLRESLEVDRSRLVPLRRELTIVENYLQIEQTRFGERLRYKIAVPEEFADIEVPPFCLQTLVENSVKHVVSTRREGAEICVDARREGGLTILEVSDDGPGFEASSVTPGHGLDNLQDRLLALFDGAGRLQVARRDGRSVVAFAVPRRKAVA